MRALTAHVLRSALGCLIGIAILNLVAWPWDWHFGWYR